MTTGRIVHKIESHTGESFNDVPAVNSEDQPADLKALRESLTMKRQLLTLLEKGDYIRDVDPIKADIDRAIADLDEIIRAFPDEDFSV